MNHTGIVLSITVLLIIASVSAYSNEYSRYNGFTYSVTGGMSIPTGFYNGYLEDGPRLTFNTFYRENRFSLPLYYKGGISYSNYELKTGGSYLHQYDITGGIFTTYRMHPLLLPFIGIDLHGLYSRINTANTGETGSALKPGLSINLGNMAYLGSGVGLLFLIDYRITDISGELFKPITISAGLTFNNNDSTRDLNRESEAEVKFQLYQKAQTAFRSRNFEEAKKLFNEVHMMDSEYPGLDYNLQRIREIESDKKQADNFISLKNYIRAIPHLQFCAPYIAECENNLRKYRRELAAGIGAWERDGIRHYEAARYRECINTMERILLVDPGNRTANIYLPRAIRRQQAIEALQR